MQKKPLISYIRVSTAQQGRSDLGLEAQREAIFQFAKAEGVEISGEFIEIQSGRASDALEKRPELSAAVQTAKRDGCAIVVAKLDRLSRDVHFHFWFDGAQGLSSSPSNWAMMPIRFCCICTLLLPRKSAR